MLKKSASKVWLVIGLGNPGREYANTRHNIGFVLTDKAISNFQFSIFKQFSKFKAQISKGTIGKQTVIIAQPQTFMNESSQAVGAIMNFYKIKPDHLIVAHDDWDIPLGQIKIQKNRSAAGHNGVQSIIDQLGTQGFIRLRLGIGAKRPSQQDGASFVLAKFDKIETKQLEEILTNAVEAVKMLIEEGLEKAMTKYN
jgi:PTH1 family peptidyl-tRNA hydrolase